MINIAVKSKCTGCSACVQKCPKQCISFEEDSEGFYYPQVKLSLCINCGLCENVCPVLHQDKPRTPIYSIHDCIKEYPKRINRNFFQ
jgi:ferredoxin